MIVSYVPSSQGLFPSSFNGANPFFPIFSVSRVALFLPLYPSSEVHTFYEAVATMLSDKGQAGLDHTKLLAKLMVSAACQGAPVASLVAYTALVSRGTWSLLPLAPNAACSQRTLSFTINALQVGFFFSP